MKDYYWGGNLKERYRNQFRAMCADVKEVKTMKLRNPVK